MWISHYKPGSSIFCLEKALSGIPKSGAPSELRDRILQRICSWIGKRQWCQISPHPGERRKESSVFATFHLNKKTNFILCSFTFYFVSICKTSLSFTKRYLTMASKTPKDYAICLIRIITLYAIKFLARYFFNNYLQTWVLVIIAKFWVLLL